MASRGPKRAFFDLWARFYDLPWVQRSVYRAPQDAVLAELRAAGCRRVLDVGCGTGLLGARIRRAFPGVRVTGCDFSAGMLAAARARDRRIGWVQGDAGRLPFRDRAFDAVVSTEAFHWFPDPEAALAEFRRVLAPRGVVCIALVNPRFALAADLVARAARAIGEPFRWPTTDEMRRRVRAAGFTVDRQVRLFRLPGGLLFPPVLTVARRAPATRRTRRPSRGSARSGVAVR